MGLVQTDNLVPIITTADAKAHLRLDTADDDTYVAGLVLAATDWLEGQTNLTLTPRTFRFTLNTWPASGTVVLPRPPLVAVTSITIAGQTIDPTSYTVEPGNMPGTVTMNGTAAAGPVVITYTAGYPSTPPALMHAARLLVGGWFFNREAAADRTITNLPSSVALESIVNTYRMPFAGGQEP